MQKRNRGLEVWRNRNKPVKPVKPVRPVTDNRGEEGVEKERIKCRDRKQINSELRITNAEEE